MARLFVSIAAFLILSLDLRAQRVESQIDRVRQFSTLPGALTTESSAGAVLPPAVAPSAEDDSFGTQVILKRQERARPFSAFAEIGAFVTDNVALAKRDEQEDAFLVGTAGGAFTHRFALPVRVDLSARMAAYRYEKLTELDFQSVDLSAGAAWSPPALGGVELYARYTFTQLTTSRGTREFFHNHAALVGAQRAFAISRAHAVYVGASAQWSRAEPEPIGRDEYNAYAGYRVQLTRRADADVFYRYGYHVYRRGQGRRDHNHAASLTVRYQPTDWVTLSASGFYGSNRSNQDVFDYDVGNLGASVQLAVRF